MNTKHIFVIMGPAGCGKTATAKALAKTLEMPMVEGDDYHSQSNKQKMASNIPLTDKDRWEWLETCVEAAMSELYNDTEAKCVFLSCSALKQAYRDKMRKSTLKGNIDIHFVYMKVEEEVLVERIERREAHYMKPGMVKSQLEALEEPGPEEKDAITVDAGRELGQVVEKVLEIVKRLVQDH